MFNCMALLMQMELRVVHANLCCHVSEPPKALCCPQNEAEAPCNHTELSATPLNLLPGMVLFFPLGSSFSFLRSQFRSLFLHKAYSVSNRVCARSPSLHVL